MKQIGRFILIAVALFVILFAVLRNYCPTAGLAFTKSRWDFHQLKNRTAWPQQSDFDSRVTLEALLQPSQDQTRWSTSSAGRIEGYVVSISLGPLEAANCYCRRDIHIMLAPRPDALPPEQIVLEVTPRTRAIQAAGPLHLPAAPSDAKTSEGILLQDWSLEALQRELTGRRVRFEGWLLFDSSHAGESENIAPGRTNNWRATAWELHPITKIEILK
jgi:hypothetical protein